MQGSNSRKADEEMLSLRSRLKVLNEIGQQEREEEEDRFTGSPEEKKIHSDARRERRRRRIITELFETEKTYIYQLELIHKHFDFQLRFACIIPADVHAKIFGIIEQILEVNRRLFDELEQSTVGQAFLHLGPFLKLYSLYANNHEQASETLQEWLSKSPELQKFVKTQEVRPDVKGLKLNALLITPIQRIPRYKLLLEDLLKHTSEEHHDYIALKEATEKVAEIAVHINEQIRQHENFQKMISIQNMLIGSAPKLVAPGRYFLKEGMLKKVSRKGKRVHDRMFFLFSDLLLYAKPKFLDSDKKTYTCSCMFPLQHCAVEPVFGTESKEEGGRMFRITCQDESLLLYANEARYAEEWIETLQIAVRKFSSNRQTLRKHSSNKTPLRGIALVRKRQLERKHDPLAERRSQTLRSAESKQCHFKSPCIKDSLHPMRRQLNRMSDLNVSGCLSPRKQSKLNKDPEIDTVLQAEIELMETCGIDNHVIDLDDESTENAENRLPMNGSPLVDRPHTRLFTKRNQQTPTTSYRYGQNADLSAPSTPAADSFILTEDNLSNTYDISLDMFSENRQIQRNNNYDHDFEETCSSYSYCSDNSNVTSSASATAPSVKHNMSEEETATVVKIWERPQRQPQREINMKDGVSCFNKMKSQSCTDISQRVTLSRSSIMQSCSSGLNTAWSNVKSSKHKCLLQ